MSAIKKFQECTKVLNELSLAAVSARTEVQKLLTVLEGPATVHTVNETRSKAIHTPLDNATGWDKGDVGVTNAMGGAHYHTEAVERYNNCTGAGYQTEHWHLDTAGPPLTKMGAEDVKKMEAMRMCWEPLTWKEPIVNFPSTMTYENLNKQYS